MTKQAVRLLMQQRLLMMKGKDVLNYRLPHVLQQFEKLILKELSMIKCEINKNRRPDYYWTTINIPNIYRPTTTIESHDWEKYMHNVAGFNKYVIVHMFSTMRQ